MPHVQDAGIIRIIEKLYSPRLFKENYQHEDWQDDALHKKLPASLKRLYLENDLQLHLLV